MCECVCESSGGKVEEGSTGRDRAFSVSNRKVSLIATNTIANKISEHEKYQTIFFK